MSFQCIIVTPEQQVMDDTVRQVILPAHDGQIGILTDRAPLLAKLGMGGLLVDPMNGARQAFFIEGGIAQMKDNKLTILTNEAIPVAEIDLETARAEQAEATARIATDEATRTDRDRRVQRARLMQDLARSR